MMRFLSVCSGIEAASVAWNPLGWQAVAFSEIDPFPCAVLAYHYPDVPNWGDMTKYKEWPDADVDLLCGGTPCQSFSVAGLRKGLDDPRGNLMLTFGAIAGRYRPRWLVWENVPGVLSSNGGRDFGTFLGMLGELGYGVAYRILDAQYFGVAQRRRRVFVVGYLGDWRRAAAVLFERHSLSGHPAPSREAGQGFAADIAPSLTASGRGVERIGESRGQDPVIAQCLTTGTGQRYDPETETILPVAFNSRQDPVSGDVSGALDTCSPQAQAVCIHADAIGRTGEAVTPSADAEGRIRLRNPGLGVIDDGTSYNLMATGQPHAVCVTGDITHTLRAEGFDASEDGTGRGQQIVSVSLRGRDGGATAELGDEAGNCLRASSGGGDKPYVLVNQSQIGGKQHANAEKTRPIEALRILREAIGEEAFCVWSIGILAALQPAQVLQSSLHGTGFRCATFSRSWVVHCALSRQEDCSAWLLQSLRETECEGCPPQGWEPSEQLTRELGAYLSELSQPGAQAARFVRDLREASEGSGLLRQALSAVQEVGRSSGSETQSAHRTYAVRRLTVEECEFLQGFPRGYTRIPTWNGWRAMDPTETPESCAAQGMQTRQNRKTGKWRVRDVDGPRYKALGNSWCTAVARWIGERIEQIESLEVA